MITRWHRGTADTLLAFVLASRLLGILGHLTQAVLPCCIHRCGLMARGLDLRRSLLHGGGRDGRQQLRSGLGALGGLRALSLQCTHSSSGARPRARHSHGRQRLRRWLVWELILCCLRRLCIREIVGGLFRRPLAVISQYETRLLWTIVGGHARCDPLGHDRRGHKGVGPVRRRHQSERCASTLLYHFRCTPSSGSEAHVSCQSKQLIRWRQCAIGGLRRGSDGRAVTVDSARVP
mmetsp:Transcript_14040/g.36317  ORF Transcript_14040/g.36317 Transcript_14040/m.36317 type:complete len:235 (-) Transcript_14040:815-1519(-)